MNLLILVNGQHAYPSDTANSQTGLAIDLGLTLEEYLA